MHYSASLTVRPPQNAPRGTDILGVSLLHALHCAQGWDIEDVQTPACPAYDHAQLALTAAWDLQSLRPCAKEDSV